MVAGLLLALAEGTTVSLVGAVRISVLAGELTLLGAALRAGAVQDVASPPFDSALCARASGVQDVRLVRGSAGDAVLAALARSPPRTAGSAAHHARCVVCLAPVPELAGGLREYDVEGAGLALEEWSRDVPGAVITLVSPWGSRGGRSEEGAVVPCRGFGSKEGVAHALPRSRNGGSQRCRVVTRTMLESPHWEAAADAIVAAAHGRGASATAAAVTPLVTPSIFVSGPKGSGKSTFARFLVNTLLTRTQSGDDDACGIAYLDCDMGQPEHTPPGCVSLSLISAPLLTPPHLRTHHCLPEVPAMSQGMTPGAEALAWQPPIAQMTPGAEDAAAAALARQALLRAHRNDAFLPPPPPCLLSAAAARVVEMRFLGSASPRDDPLAFVAAVGALISRYRSEFAPRGIPLVVNSHGWNRGLGFEMLADVLTLLAPTHSVMLLAGRGADRCEGDGGSGEENVDEGEGEEGDAARPHRGQSPVHGGAGAGMLQQQQPSPRGGGGARGAEEHHVEVLWPPPVAWQPPSLRACGQQHLSELLGGSGGGRAGGDSRSVSVSAVLFRIPAWHCPPIPPAAGSARGVWGGGGDQRGDLGGGGVNGTAPPRAARSPPDLRCYRFLVYLLSNLRGVDPRALEEDVTAGAVAAGAGAGGGGGVASVQNLSALGAGAGAGGVVGGGDGGGEAAGGIVPPCDGEDNPPSAETGADGANASNSSNGADGAGAVGVTLEEEEGEEEEEEEEEEEADDGVEEVGEGEFPMEWEGVSLHPSSPLLRRPTDTPLHLLSRPAAHSLYWHAMAHAARTCFWSVMNDGRVVRAPCSGTRSPAWHARASLALKVPADDVILLLSTHESVRVKHTPPGGSGGDGAATSSAPSLVAQSRATSISRAASLVGQIVALCAIPPPPRAVDEGAGVEEGACTPARLVSTPGLRLGLPPHLAALALGAGGGSGVGGGGGGGGRGCAEQSIPSTSLPCLALGYVRAFNVRGDGRLHILSPLPLHTAPAVRVLVSWHGAADVPVSLLYRGAPEGDPFCYPPELVTAPLRATGAVGGDGGTSRRGTLKRGRRGDGKG